MSTLQSLLQYSSTLTIEKQTHNNQIVKQIVSDNTKFNENGEIIIDKKRTFSTKEKQKIWNDAKPYKQFNKDFVRVDIMGHVVIKDLQRIDQVRKPLSAEYEHINSHSKGGETVSENGCLLQSKVNNIKREIPIFDLDRKDYIKYKKHYAVKPKELHKGLENDRNYICKKYNMAFEKEGKKWFPVVLAKTKNGKNIYKPFDPTKEDFYYINLVSKDAKYKDRLDSENYKKLDNFYNFSESSNKESFNKDSFNKESSNKEYSNKESFNKESSRKNKKGSMLEKPSVVVEYLPIVAGIAIVVVIGGVCYGSYKIYKYYQYKQKQKQKQQKIYHEYQENIQFEYTPFYKDTKFYEDTNFYEDVKSYRDINLYEDINIYVDVKSYKDTKFYEDVESYRYTNFYEYVKSYFY